MITIIIKRNDEPKVIQMTQEIIMRELGAINGAEMLLEDRWTDGLKKVRTPFVCLVEADCVLSSNYLSSNFGLMKKLTTTENGKGGGYTKLAVLASCLGIKDYGNRVYNYNLEQVQDKNLTYYQPRPFRDKRSTTIYPVQIGFIPGAVMRMSSIKDSIDALPWDGKDLVEMSTAVCFHLWNTNRRVQVNPNTTYVSNVNYLEEPPLFNMDVPIKAINIFHGEGL